MLQLIIDIIGAARRRAALVVAAMLLLCAAGLTYSAYYLRVDTDTNRLFSAKLAWRKAQILDATQFPQFNNLIVAVVRGATPEEAAETARALNTALNADTANFHGSSYPAGLPFYSRQGLLLLPAADLAKLLNAIVAAQPFLGQLAADPSARGLFTGLSLIAEGVQMGQANLTPYAAALKGVQANLEQAAAGHPEPLSWQALLSNGAPGQNVEFVLAHPALHQGTLQVGGAATAALVRIAAQLPDVAAGRVTVDYTGQIPLSDEQFASLTQGLVAGGVVSVLLIALWLYLALRGWRLILPIIATLLLGLCLTISFAAVTIGVINLISVAFAILFIGLAVDFAIQFCVRLRDVRHQYGDLAAALPETGRQAGGQIALAAASTACGFLAFAPTPFVGVAELGVIAGAGMFIAFGCTITFLPALLCLFRPRLDHARIGLPFSAQADAFLLRRHRPVLLGFAVLAGIGLLAAMTLRFDANPLDTKDPSVPSMRTLTSLLDNPATDPFYVTALAPNLAAAKALAAKLSKLPEVDGVISGATFVPDGQPLKLAMIAQAQNILAPTLAAQSATAPVTAADLRLSMRMARDSILKAKNVLPAGSPLLGIAASLSRLLRGSDAQVLAMNRAITRFLPLELGRLNSGLSPSPITQANLPPAIARDWFLPDGQVRVEALPTAAAQTTPGLRRFAHAVQTVAPEAGGPAISTIATAGTILASFRAAALLAALAICAILFFVFRNIRDMALVVSTLALSALLTALFAKLANISINYANIIALPLLLGVGVSFNVYFVMNYRAGMRRFLSSATAHAVLFSALTTGTAFGTLAASHDRGTASMGMLLLLSLLAVLISTFFYLPALLYLLMNAGKTQP